jgi:ribosomal protein S18 acetylase RimI-like enzyme
MNIRPIREEDIEQVIQLFRLNYGDDYAIPEFYDPLWVKRGIYSDHIIWMVIEEAGQIVASGAAILDFGDYNDQIAEIGRLVVDPNAGGRGLGRQLLDALVDESDNRVEFAFGEARTTHIKTQRLFDRVGLPPLGFLPMMYPIRWRESWVLSGQLFNNGRRLRHPGPAHLVPEAVELARLSLRNLELEELVQAHPEARPYPFDHSLQIEPISGSSLVRLLKIEQGRLLDPEVFGGLSLDQGLPHLQARRACYLVASDGSELLGAVGYIPDHASRNVRIIELIGRDEAAKGCLLRRAVEEAEEQHHAEVIDCDVSAQHPRIQRTLLELGFLPAAYVPGMVFHHTARWDVLKMVRLGLPWDLGPLELAESAQEMYDVVAPAFIHQAGQRQRKQLARAAAVFSSLAPLELDIVHSLGEEIVLAPGSELPLDCLHVILQGEIQSTGRSYQPGESLGTSCLLTRRAGLPFSSLQGAELFRLSLPRFDDLCTRHPHLGIKLYRLMAAQQEC